MHYKRVLIKISGEALGGKNTPFDGDILRELAQTLVELNRRGLQIALVVGAGNIWRGKNGGDMEQNVADQLGMLATTMNALALQDAICRAGAACTVMSATPMESFTDYFTPRAAQRALENGEIIVFAGGTGHAFFTTDTTAALRAAEIHADGLLYAKNVDGVYSADPNLDSGAVRYDTLTFEKALADNLKALDNTAIALCMNNNLTAVLFALNPISNLVAAAEGRVIGTVMKN